MTYFNELSDKLIKKMPIIIDFALSRFHLCEINKNDNFKAFYIKNTIN